MNYHLFGRLSPPPFCWLFKHRRDQFFRLFKSCAGCCCLAFFVSFSTYATDQAFAMSSELIAEQEYQAAQIDILVAKLLDQGVEQEDVLAILDDDTLSNHDVINIFMALISEGRGDLLAMDCDINQRHVQWCIDHPFGHYCTEYCKEIESEPTPSTPEPPYLPPETPVIEPEPTPEPPSEPPVLGPEPPPESGGSPWWKFWGE